VSQPFLSVELELPDEAESVPLCRHVVGRTLAILKVDEELAANIEMAVGEAAGNVARHAYQHPGHRYRVSLKFFADRIQLRVEDDGCGLVREAVPKPDLERSGGRGLWLMEQLATFLSISQRAGGGCVLEATFALAAPLCVPPRLDEAGRKSEAVTRRPLPAEQV
jgi:anti-sigma regulatory factor (Ser/Thr protein kinase)